jgi:hypothetical protein
MSHTPPVLQYECTCSEMWSGFQNADYAEFEHTYRANPGEDISLSIAKPNTIAILVQTSYKHMYRYRG